jgi:Myb-like DNA-binding domain
MNLEKLVKENGAGKWTFIAQHLKGRVGKQCRERWHNHLNPEINKAPWEEEENWRFFLVPGPHFSLNQI